MRFTSHLITALAGICSARAWSTYVVPHIDGADDVPGLTTALANFTEDATILFDKGTTYNIWTPLIFPELTNVEVLIEGNLTYPEDIPTIQAIVASDNFPGTWFTFTGGDNVTLRGSEDPDWGWIDAHGQAWWNQNNQENRPHGWSFSKITNGVIRDMKLWKPIAWNFKTSGSSNLHAFNNVILAASDNSSAFPFNTDGFSAGGTDMLFENNHIVNGDDCITVGSGTKNIHFRNSYCEGGHGLSIGSLGKNGDVADVQNILIENVTMQSTLYGARFKSWLGGNGLARNITWKDITFNDVPFPIYVTQNYWDQEVGENNSTDTNSTHIEDFTFQNFTGTIRDTPYVEGSCVSNPCWYYVANATGREIVIFDLYPETATNIITKDLFPKTETGAQVDVLCNATTISNDVGFQCVNGPFVKTEAGQ